LKLYEIENYLEKKVRRKDHDKGYYIFFTNGVWTSNVGFYYHIGNEITCDDWEEYVEPKEKKVKRFWKWAVQTESGLHYSSDFYVDDDGKDANGNYGYSCDWETSKKKKCENDFIDCVLVDGKWELEG